MDFFMSGEVSAIKDKEMGEKFNKCRKVVEGKISAFVADRTYGEEVTSIAIIPIIDDISPELEAAGFGKERKLFQRKSHGADYRLKIDYNSFSSGNDEQRNRLLIKNIIDSVRHLSTKAKKDFDAKALERDILAVFNLSYEQL